MWLSDKESACQCRRWGFSPWIGKIPWRRKWQPTPVFLPGESHGQRSLAGYSPWLCRVRQDWAIEHTHSRTHSGISNWSLTRKLWKSEESRHLKKKKKFFFKGCFPLWYFWFKRFWQLLLRARITGLAMCSLPSPHRILSVSGNQPFWISVVSALLLPTRWSPGKERIKRSETKSGGLVKVSDRLPSSTLLCAPAHHLLGWWIPSAQDPAVLPHRTCFLVN